MSVNKATLIGNLGKDPEIKTMQSGDRLCTFSLATNERWTDKRTGEQKEKTEWHQIVIWNENLIKIAEKYLRKGSKVYLEGRIETRKWQDQSGTDKYTTEIVLKFNCAIDLLDTKASRGGDEEVQEREPMKPTPRKKAASSGYDPDLDDQIPF